MRMDVSLRAMTRVWRVMRHSESPHSRILSFAREAFSFVALCRLTDITSRTNAASFVVVGPLKQGMIVFVILRLRARNGLHGLRGGIRGSIEYHPGSRASSSLNHDYSIGLQ